MRAASAAPCRRVLRFDSRSRQAGRTRQNRSTRSPAGGDAGFREWSCHATSGLPSMSPPTHEPKCRMLGTSSDPPARRRLWRAPPRSPRRTAARRGRECRSDRTIRARAHRPPSILRAGCSSVCQMLVTSSRTRAHKRVQLGGGRPWDVPFEQVMRDVLLLAQYRAAGRFGRVSREHGFDAHGADQCEDLLQRQSGALQAARCNPQCRRAAMCSSR